MHKRTFAEILIPQKIGVGNDLLTYEVPSDSQAQIGMSVKVPLRNKVVFGIIWNLHHIPPSFKTLPIKELLLPLLGPGQIKLIDWFSHYYFHPRHLLLKTFIPKRVLENKEFKGKKAKEDQIIRSQAKNLSKEQEEALEKVKTSMENKFLIHGITGSGKTEIYTRLAAQQIEKNGQILIMVPEIALTPQNIDYFQKTLGLKAEVIHSRIAEGEKYATWKRIHSGQSKLIIGSRSAIFSPFQNLQLIIIDEEHENSYKQDTAPRYKAHTVAEKLLDIFPKCKLVLGSATPSIETATKYAESTIHLHSRIGTSTLPEIEIVDLRTEFKKGNYSIFSETLQEAIKQSLEKKEQVILFLNRRGSASSIVCRDCGFTEKCTDCDLPLTYHEKNFHKSLLICHHCGKVYTPAPTCKNCQSANIRFLGIGTERIESEVKKLFPEAKTLRADKDTTGKKDSFKKIYDSFKKQEANILIGTQMIAKGLHLPQVNLVGVIVADIGLNIPDFRSAERNFQLLTQVAGRSGRDSQSGKVIIQTYNPSNFTLLCAQKHDYEGFYKYESTQRKILKNPPFSTLAKIVIQKTQLPTCEQTAKKILNLLQQISRDKQLEKDFEINCYPAFIAKLRGKYQYFILIKALQQEHPPHDLLAFLPEEYIIDEEIKIDIDPINTV